MVVLIMVRLEDETVNLKSLALISERMMKKMLQIFVTEVASRKFREFIE